MSALAPTYFEYWSMPEHDQEHQYRQYFWKYGEFKIQFDAALRADGSICAWFEDNPLSRPIGMAGAP